jgi:hypothetical protein
MNCIGLCWIAWAHSLLQTLPGTDEVAAALILIEIGGDIARFGWPERLACWAALSPGNHESAGKRKSGRTRHGNHIIRCILCECANAARWTKGTPAAKYKSSMVRKSHKKAIVAVAHKMIRLIYILLSRREAYRDQAIDYAAISAKKNETAPRWLEQLEAIVQLHGVDVSGAVVVRLAIAADTFVAWCRIVAPPPSEWSPAERFLSGPGPQPAAALEPGCRCRSLFLERDERTNAGALHNSPHATSRASEQAPKAAQRTNSQRSTWGSNARSLEPSSSWPA